MSQPMNEHVIQTSNLGKRFGRREALSGVDFTVNRGSVVGLLGMNGAGKTTLLKCLLGLLRPTSGAAGVFGEDSRDLSPAAKAHIGYVPQEPSIYPWMTVGQVIDYTAAFYQRWNRGLIASLAGQQRLGMAEKVGPLSVGQRQTLATLLALGHEPELLVLDEPVASLDPAARRLFLRTLLDIAADGSRTVLFSTHITSDLERIASEVAILRNGRIELHTDLGALKDSVKRLRIASDPPDSTLPPDLAVPGSLNFTRNGHTATATVRGFTESLPHELRQRWNVQVTVQDLNLEEIFLELHGG